MHKTIRAGALLLTLALSLAPLAAAGNDKTSTASGNVTKLNAAERAVNVAVADGTEMRFVWTADTKINGTLAPGARITVRYTTLPDGQNLAHQISVARN
ncbi:MAG TPA: hypothetical protein VJ776_01540 [Thermoanaerobaculia bacterium]|jgi:uncharacterized protein YabE (DUF348 family)|nr:hypothetical protein [Thermoanaerobaculia bacterium]